MEGSVWDSTLEFFRERVESGDTGIAAAAVAMVSAACAVSLVVMVLAVIGRRKDFAGDRTRLESLIEAAKTEASRLKKYADADPQAYAEYMETVRLPKSTEEERQERKRAMHAALQKATAVPLAAARSATVGAALCAEASELASGAVATDLGGGAALLAGAVRAILATVNTNLRSLGDSPFSRQAAEESRELEARAFRNADAVLARLRGEGEI